METHWAGVINKVILAGADTGQLKGVEEELLSSSQQRRQKLDANPFLKPPSLEKQTSGMSCCNRFLFLASQILEITPPVRSLL